MDLYLLFWCIIAGVLSALTIIVIKQYIITNNIIWLVLSVVAELLLIYSYIKVFSNDNISSYYPIIKIISILLVAAAGILIFSEPLTIKLVIGLALAIIAMYLLI